MSKTTEDIHKAFPDGVIDTIRVNKSDLHGEDAVEIMVNLVNGKFVTGTFAKHPRAGFGGVQFSGPKDISGLMIHKIRSVLDGTAELSDD